MSKHQWQDYCTALAGGQFRNVFVNSAIQQLKFYSVFNRNSCQRAQISFFYLPKHAGCPLSRYTRCFRDDFKIIGIGGLKKLSWAQLLRQHRRQITIAQATPT